MSGGFHALHTGEMGKSDRIFDPLFVLGMFMEHSESFSSFLQS